MRRVKPEAFFAGMETVFGRKQAKDPADLQTIPLKLPDFTMQSNAREESKTQPEVERIPVGLFLRGCLSCRVQCCGMRQHLWCDASLELEKRVDRWT